MVFKQPCVIHKHQKKKKYPRNDKRKKKYMLWCVIGHAYTNQKKKYPVNKKKEETL